MQVWEISYESEPTASNEPYVSKKDLAIGITCCLARKINLTCSEESEVSLDVFAKRKVLQQQQQQKAKTTSETQQNAKQGLQQEKA